MKTHLKTRFYYIRSGIFKWVFKSGILENLGLWYRNPVWKRPIAARYLNLDPFWHKMIEGAPSSRALFTSSTSHDLSECWKMLKQPDFNAILIVVVENWLWELHDVEYHGVHLINLSKSSRFVSVNHVSVCQKTEKTIFYSNAASAAAAAACFALWPDLLRWVFLYQYWVTAESAHETLRSRNITNFPVLINQDCTLQLLIPRKQCLASPG